MRIISEINYVLKNTKENNFEVGESPSDGELSSVSAQIHHIKISNRQKWIQTIESCSHKCNPSHLWSMLKSHIGKRAVTPNNQPITFYSKTLTHNLEIATAFAKQFTSIVPHTSPDDDRRDCQEGAL